MGVADFCSFYSPGHDGFCCVQLSILETRLEFSYVGPQNGEGRCRLTGFRMALGRWGI